MVAKVWNYFTQVIISVQLILINGAPQGTDGAPQETDGAPQGTTLRVKGILTPSQGGKN